MLRRLFLLSLLALTCHCSGGSSGGGGPIPTTDDNPVAEPSITSVSPNNAAPTEIITISGQNFDVSANDNQVHFGDTQATTHSVSSSEITVEVPNLSPGDYDITITTSAGRSTPFSFQVTNTPSQAPAITSVSPGQASANTSLTITGENFDLGGQSTVTIGGVSASVVTNSSTELQVTVPSGAQSGALVVSSNGQSSNAIEFMVTSGSAANQGFSGSQAVDFLNDSQFTHLVVEIDHIEGKAPTAEALNLLLTRLNERCHKAGGITFIVDDAIPDQGQDQWSNSEIMLLEAQYRDHYRNGNTNVLYFVYLNGNYELDTAGSQILGLAYTGSSHALFYDNIQQATLPLLSHVRIERAVLVHELGHNLGLVNNGIAMVNDHQDTANGNHDVNDDCPMHVSIEAGLFNQLTNSVPNQFDAECIADMQAAGGK